MSIDTKNMNNDEFVVFCYNWVIKKQPDQENQKAYKAALDAGNITREELLIELLTSDYNRRVLAASEFVPHGHFYSALPSGEDRVEFLRNRSFPDALPAIDTNEKGQLALLEEFKAYYAECPFPEEKTEGIRYYFENQSYGYTDAIILYSMIRHARPERIIEVGSGYSSCVILDTIDRFFDGQVGVTFVEPFPGVLHSLISGEDAGRHSIIEQKLQDVDLAMFQALEADDILFIDSTHVSKLQSDVNRLVFDILPCLKPGVLIHIHDIIWPFDYPDVWVKEGKAWNEAYILRAFLEYNRAFEIVFFSSYITSRHRDWFHAHMPQCLKNTGGNIWLKKVAE